MRQINRWRLGAVHSGLGEWLLQRVSSIYLLLFLVWCSADLALHPVHGFEDWRAWVFQPVMRIAWGLCFLALIGHAWVGIRSVYLDYLKPFWLRFIIELLTLVVVLGMVLWVTEILWFSQ